MADLVALSSRIIDSGVVDEPVNRITNELSEVADGLAVVESFSHSVVLDAGDGLVAFDASHARTGSAVVAAIEAWSSTPVTHLVYTHGHADHVGGIPSLVARGGVRLALPGRMRGYVAGERPRTPGPRAAARIRPVLSEQPRCLRVVPEIVRSSFTIGVHPRGCRLPVDCDHWLADGDEIPGAPQWRVAAATCHTDDSMVFVRGRDEVMLSGDAVLTRAGRGWFTPELVDAADGAATEDALRKVPVRYLLPGHGRPVVGRDVMAAAASPGWSG